MVDNVFRTYEENLIRDSSVIQVYHKNKKSPPAKAGEDKKKLKKQNLIQTGNNPMVTMRKPAQTR
ncbi:hypothetical protein GCM10028826_03530 [Mucilaginibacter boryungensis]